MTTLARSGQSWVGTGADINDEHGCSRFRLLEGADCLPILDEVLHHVLDLLCFRVRISEAIWSARIRYFLVGYFLVGTSVSGVDTLYIYLLILIPRYP
eukprot:SAG31_NODE_6906_length_1855_cov_8.808656_1_plen_98_part_00